VPFIAQGMYAQAFWASLFATRPVLLNAPWSYWLENFLRNFYVSKNSNREDSKFYSIFFFFWCEYIHA
jgi:hypothetical protein